MRNYLISLLAIAALTACNQPELVYESYQKIRPAGWDQDSALAFEVEIQDVEPAYFIRLNVRHTVDYPLANLYLFREIKQGASRAFGDTINISLANAYGEWNGDGFGNLRTLSVPYRPEPVHFKKPGTYTFNLKHGMRMKQLPGIQDIGISLERVAPTNEQQKAN